MRSSAIRPIMVEIDRGGPESASKRCDDRIWYQTDGRYLGSETNVEGSYKWQLCSECFHACYHFQAAFHEMARQ
jgi:hypothetical protein